MGGDEIAVGKPLCYGDRRNISFLESCLQTIAFARGELVLDCNVYYGDRPVANRLPPSCICQPNCQPNFKKRS